MNNIECYQSRKCIFHLPKKVDFFGKCNLYGSKKREFYRFKTSNMSKSDVPELSEHFNFANRNNCCKVISYSLFTSVAQVKTAVDVYIKHLAYNIQKAQEFLPEYLIRIYTDFSLFTYVPEGRSVDAPEVKLHERLSKFLKMVSDAPNVELYVLECPDAMENNTLIYKQQQNVRTFRFFSLLDPEVAISVIRDADSLLTEEECDYIKLWERGKDIFLNINILVPNRKLFFYITDIDRQSGEFSASIAESQKLIELGVNNPEGQALFLDYINEVSADDSITVRQMMQIYREKKLAKSPYLKTEYEENFVKIEKKITNLSYQKWLNAYKIYKLELMNIFTAVDLLAGCVAFKFGLNSEKFLHAMMEVTNFLNENKRKISGKDIQHGFDEMLLMEYFIGINSFAVNPPAKYAGSFYRDKIESLPPLIKNMMEVILESTEMFFHSKSIDIQNQED